MKTFFTTIICLLLSLNGFCDKFVWNSKAPYPLGGRHRCAAFSIGNKGYLGVGHVNSGTVSTAYPDWWEFDPSTNSWSQKADYPQARFATETFVIGNKGYMGGGNEQSFGDRDEFYEFDPIANTWTPKANIPIANGGGVGFAINGTGYLFLSGSLFSYNVSSNVWAPVSCAVPHSDYSSAFVLNNKVYVLPTGTQTLYMFDPATGITTTKANFIGNGRYAACSFAVRGQGYIGLGADMSTGWSVVKDFYQYNPITDVWDTIPKTFPGLKRNYVPSFVIGDNAYLGTGSNGTNLADIWGYEWKITAGIEEQTLNTMSLYPNPTSNVVHVRLNDQVIASKPIFKLFQLDGKEVLKETITISESTINIQELAQGIYISVVSDGNGKTIATTKLIKN